MKDKLKKVTKALAKEIAAKFFGRTVKLVEGTDEYLFESGKVKLYVFPYFAIAGNAYANVIINGSVECNLIYDNGEIETENVLINESIELKNDLFTLKGYLEDAIDESKIDVNSNFLDKHIVKDKAKLLTALKILKDAEKNL